MEVRAPGLRHLRIPRETDTHTPCSQRTALPRERSHASLGEHRR